MLFEHDVSFAKSFVAFFMFDERVLCFVKNHENILAFEKLLFAVQLANQSNCKRFEARKELLRAPSNFLSTMQCFSKTISRSRMS